MQLRRALSFSILAFMACTMPAFAERGIFVRSGTSSVANPESGYAWVLDAADRKLKVYNGSAWEPRILPKLNMSATAAPSVNDDAADGYEAGSIWLDTVGKQTYVCTDATNGAAVWYAFSNRISAADVVNKLTTADIMADWVVTGLLGSDPGSSLTMTTPAGTAYTGGNRVVVGSGIQYTYTAGKDTYDYLQTNGTINHVAVPNNDPEPTGQSGLLLQKVVTDGSEITSVAQMAATLPRIKASAATVSSEVVTLGQGDARYAPIAVSSGGAQRQAWMTPENGSGAGAFRAITNNDLPVVDLSHGGVANGSLTAPSLALLVGDGSKYVPSASPGGALKKVRTNAAGDAYEFVDDTNGTVTTVSMTAPSSIFDTPVSVSNAGTTPAISLTFKTGVTQNQVVASPNGSSGAVGPRALVNADLPAPIDLAHGGTNNTSLAATNWTVAVLDGSKVINSPALAANQSIRRSSDGNSWEAFTPSAATTNVLGGDGGDGAVSASGTETTPVQVNATTFSVANGVTYTVKSGTVINATGAITIGGGTSGTVDVSTNGTGAPSATLDPDTGRSRHGRGPGGGTNGDKETNASNRGAGGGGGAFGGDGGRGGSTDQSQNKYGLGGLAYELNCFVGGSGGGSGGIDDTGTSPGAGGPGGGSLRICGASTITIASGAIVQANGGAGGAGSGGDMGGGGGGGGGYLGIYCTGTLTLTGTLKAEGGNGGACASSNGGEGGGGGGGIVLRMAPTLSGAGTVSVAGGQGDSNTGTNGVDGSSGQSFGITQLPTLPLIAHAERSSYRGLLYNLAIARGLRTGDTLYYHGRPFVQWLAAWHAKPGMFNALCQALFHGGLSSEQLARLTNINCAGLEECGLRDSPVETVMVGDFITEQEYYNDAA